MRDGGKQVGPQVLELLQPDHQLWMARDLRIEHALRESQAQLARTEAFALVMTAHLSLDGRWLKVPPTLCRLLGMEQDRLLGTSIDTLLRRFFVVYRHVLGRESARERRLVGKSCHRGHERKSVRPHALELHPR